MTHRLDLTGPMLQACADLARRAGATFICKRPRRRANLGPAPSDLGDRVINLVSQASRRLCDAKRKNGVVLVSVSDDEDTTHVELRVNVPKP